MAETKTIGYVGLGHAGWPMAGKLAKAGYWIVAYDADPERVHGFAEEYGATSAERLADLAGVDMAMTMLPNGNVVREVLLETDGGLASQLAPGTIVIDTSSSDPFATRELGAELAELGVILIDSPVTRPMPGNDVLTLMVGGDDEDAVRRAVSVLSDMAEHVFRAGPLGSGHAMKTLNNFVAASGLVAALDALLIGNRYGLDPETMLEVFNLGTAQNFSTIHVLRDEALSRRHESGFQLALLVKDLGIAAHLTEALEFPSDMPEFVRERLADALEALGDEHADHTAALTYWEQTAGERLPPLHSSQGGVTQ